MSPQTLCSEEHGGFLGGWEVDCRHLLVPGHWGCVFLLCPKYSILDGDITNLPQHHHLLLWVLPFGVLSRRRTGMRQGGLK